MSNDLKQDVVWGMYEGRVFKAKNLQELRLQVEDYIAIRFIEDKCDIVYPYGWQNFNVGKMPTWPSITGNCCKALHMEIPMLPMNLSWLRWMDCSGIARWQK